VEYEWNYIRKTICEIADGILRKKAKTTAWNISEEALRSIGLLRRRGL